jgi:hypothetical protein
MNYEGLFKKAPRCAAQRTTISRLRRSRVAARAVSARARANPSTRCSRNSPTSRGGDQRTDQLQRRFSLSYDPADLNFAVTTGVDVLWRYSTLDAFYSIFMGPVSLRRPVGCLPVLGAQETVDRRIAAPFPGPVGRVERQLAAIYSRPKVAVTQQTPIVWVGPRGAGSC